MEYPPSSSSWVSQLCPHKVAFALLAYSPGDRVGKREIVGTMQALFNTSQNTSMLPILFQLHSQNTGQYGLIWRKLTPSQPAQK